MGTPKKMDMDEYIKQKWEKLFQFLRADAGELLSLSNLMEMPCRQIKAGKVDQGIAIAKVFKEHWDKMLKAAGKPKTLMAVNQEDWVKGHTVVATTYWYREVLTPIVSKAFFDTMDTDSDDKISIEEWRVYYNSHKVYDEDVIQSTFQKMDADGDGFITRDEYNKAKYIYDTHHEPGNDYSFLYMRNLGDMTM